MNGDEKLTELKKAYADIILNISKEAAARVMASDQRSVMYQHELKVVKDEGLRMMLRLKQIMNSRISQSQATLVNQQKKIEELEAQLQEAEDIVSDLRAELRQAQTELERAKDDHPYHVNWPINTYTNDNPIMNNLYPYQSFDYLPPNVTSHISAPVVNFGSQDLPSIILRGKEPGLYRKNGCTQRIRACDRNLLDRDLSLSEENPKVEGEKEKESKELENNKTVAVIKLIGVSSVPMKGKRAVRRRKAIIPMAVKKSLFPEDGAHSDTAKLSPDKEKTCDNQRDVIKFSGEKTMQKDNYSENEKTGNGQKADVTSCVLDLISSEDAEGVSVRPVRERYFKYTFQRKRKRQVMSESKVKDSLETGKKTSGKNDVDEEVEILNTSSSMESSWESRQLAQVARQLISLSESKWRR